MGSTGRKVVTVSAGLIALYLILINFNGATSDTNAASTGSVSLVKAFQGR